MEVIIIAGGGNDTDFCVSNINGRAVRILHPEVIFTWQGMGYVDPDNDRIFHLTPSTPGIYNVSVTAEDDGDCNAGPESKSASCGICIYNIIGVSGPNNAIRGQSCMYQVEVVGGISIIHYHWLSNHYTPPQPLTSNYWNGKIVFNTTIYCTVSLQCPYKGDIFDVNASSFETEIVKRYWSIDQVPEAVYSPELIGQIAYDCNPGVTLGRHRDAVTNVSITFYPNPLCPFWPMVAYTPEGIIDYGPNHGKWFLSSSSFEIRQEYLLNEWLNPLGPNPPGSDVNWYVQNLYNCDGYFGTAGVSAYLNSIIDHETEGNHIVNPPGVSSGHNAAMRFKESINDDLKDTIEDNVNISYSAIISQTNNEYYYISYLVNGDPDHNWVRENWYPTCSSILYKFVSTYNTDTQTWSDCDCVDPSNP